MAESALIYVHESPAEQDLDQQRKALWEYAIDDLGVHPGDIAVVEGRLTKQKTEHSSHRHFLERLREERAEHVVVWSVSHIARDTRDLHSIVGEVVDTGSGLHILEDDIGVAQPQEMEDRDREFVEALSRVAAIEDELDRERRMEALEIAERVGKHPGQPPYGFESDDDGYLIPNADFPAAQAAVEAVDRLGWSQQKAGDDMGIPQDTLSSILGCKEFYLRRAAHE